MELAVAELEMLPSRFLGEGPGARSHDFSFRSMSSFSHCINIRSLRVMRNIFNGARATENALPLAASSFPLGSCNSLIDAAGQCLATSKKITRNHNNPLAALGMHPILAIDRILRKTNVSPRHHAIRLRQPFIRHRSSAVDHS